MRWRFSALGSSVEVCSELSALESRLDALLGGYHKTEYVGSSGVRYTLRESDSQFQVLRDGNSCYRCETHEDLLDYVQIELYRYLVARVDTRWLLHAAALARGNRVIVLAGPSNAGKSTLCRALMTDGWTYLSEEVASLGDGDFDALRRPLHLDTPEQAIGIPDLGRPICMRDDPVSWIAAPPKKPINPCPGALRVAAIVRIQYRPQQATELTPLTASAALEQLWDCRMNTGLAVATLACQIVAETPCYRLDSQDLPGAMRAITSLDIA